MIIIISDGEGSRREKDFVYLAGTYAFSSRAPDVMILEHMTQFFPVLFSGQICEEGAMNLKRMQWLMQETKRNRLWDLIAVRKFQGKKKCANMITKKAIGTERTNLKVYAMEIKMRDLETD